MDLWLADIAKILTIKYRAQMQKKISEDAQLASIMDSSRQLPKPTFLCPTGNKVSEICCNKNCISSLHCSDYECELCSQKHLCCGLSSRNLSKVSNIVNKFPKYRKDVLENVERVDRKFKELLTKEFEEFIQDFPEYCLEEKNKDVFEKIYTKVNGENITGVQADEFCTQIDLKLKNYQITVPKSLKWYEDKMNELIQQAKKLKKGLRLVLSIKKKDQKGFEHNDNFKGLSQSNSQNNLIQMKQEKDFKEKNEQKGFEQMKEQKQFEKTKKMKDFESQKKGFKGFDSVILKHPNDNEKIEFLFKSLAEVGPIESLQLLFRGSKDGFKSTTFHEKCDNIHDTVVIVRTDREINNTVAGYSHYRWNQVDRDYLDDAGKKAFLLQLNRREKYVPQSKNQLICCDHDYGPIFGGGNDLCIWDDCNSNNNSCSYFPYTYNFEGPNKIKKNQQSYTDFSGATNGCYFRVIDYEVFRVVFK